MLLVFYYPYRHGVHFDLEATVFCRRHFWRAILQIEQIRLCE